MSRNSDCVKMLTILLDSDIIMDGLTPGDRTIVNFRKDNTKALRKTLRKKSQDCNFFRFFRFFLDIF